MILHGTALGFRGRQGMVTFAERTPYRAPSEAPPTSLLALHYHQGCG
jgi:hypothetical protein